MRVSVARPVPALMKGKGQPGGRDSCLAKGIVYDGQGYQICTHWDLCTPKVQLRMRARLQVLTERVGDSIPLQVLPKFKTKPEMVEECLKRKLIKKKSNHSAQKLQSFLLDFCRVGVRLEGRPEYQIDTCSEQCLNKELMDRGRTPEEKSQLGNGTVEEKRSRLRRRLLEENEYFDLKYVLKEDEFKFRMNDEDHIYTDVERNVMCVLHAVMRMHEKIINLLFMKCYSK